MTQDLRFPLHWPTGWPRTKAPQSSRFDPQGNRSFAKARDALIKELGRLNASNIILSSNIPLRQDGLPYARFKVPDDKGVAVYFNLGKEPMALACDAWDRAEDNVWAIAKHIDALRGQQRWGVGSIAQAFKGYRAIAPRKSWWEVLGVSREASVEDIKKAFRNKVKTSHPDTGADRTLFEELARAKEEGIEAQS